MKTLFRSVAMAFSMFSIVPMPMVEWKKENMKYMLCALPLVGVVIGAALWVWHILCQWLNFGAILFAAGMTLIPLAVSGGIHMDGFCDTVDALSSHAAPERKREILKDSHAGAFAIIFTAAYFLLYFALCTELPQVWPVILIAGIHHVFARAIGALAGVAFPGSGGNGMLASFREGAAKRATWILLVWCLICAAALIVLSPISGLFCTLAAVVLLLGLRVMSLKEFGGMSGDLAGYLITLSELVLLACFIFAEKVVLVCF